MASNQADSPDGDSNESKGGSKLDNLSRDDLVKFVKKQMVLLQKSKSHSDGLSRELAETKEKLKKQTDMKTEADEDAEERENLIQAYNASQMALEESASKITSLAEQVNCLQQKNETLTALYQCLQTELDTLASRNKELENSLHVMSEARDEAVKQLDSRQMPDGPSATAFVCSNCGEMKTEMDEMTVILEELRQRIEPVETERNQFKLDLSQTQEKIAKAAIFIEKLKKERQQLKEQIAELQSSQSTLLDLQEALDTVSQEQLATNVEKLRIFEELESTKADLTKSLGEYENAISEKADLVSQLADLQTAFDSVDLMHKDVLKERDVCAEKLTISQRNLDEIAQQLASLQEEKNTTLANSVELQKSLDEVTERLVVITAEKQAADKELEDRQTNLAEAARLAGEGDVNAEKLHDMEELLIGLRDELATTKSDLETEKIRNRELEERVAHSDEKGELRPETVSQPPGEAGPDETALRDDLVRELNLQIDRLKAELQLRATSEQEAVAKNEELKNPVKEWKSSIGKSFDENDIVETCDDALKGNIEEKQVEEDAGKRTPVSAQMSMSENDAQSPEVLLLQEKLAEWETMMNMLQTERDDMERELVRMGEREKRNGRLLEEILLALQNALKGRDLFHDQTKTMEDHGAIYSKLCILQSIVDETNFEREEMREKIQHLTEQVVDLEKRFLETEGSGDVSSRGKGDKIFSEESRDGGPVLLTLPCKELIFGDVNENRIGCEDEKVEGLSEEVIQWTQLLENERANSTKWKCSSDEMRQVVEDLTVEKEQLEKTLKSITGRTLSDSEQQVMEQEEDGGKTMEVLCVGDVQTRLGEAADAEDGERCKDELLMTEQVKRKTVKKSEPLRIQILFEDERLRLLEENQNLREETKLLRRQLETYVDHSTTSISTQTVQQFNDDISMSKNDGTDEGSEMHRAEKDVTDLSPGCAQDEEGKTAGAGETVEDDISEGSEVNPVEKDVTGSPLTYAEDEEEKKAGAGETVEKAGAQLSLDRLKKELAEAECLLQERKDELSRINEEINSTEKKSEGEREIPSEDFNPTKEEFEVLVQQRNFEIEMLQAELVRVSEELAKSRDHEATMVTLREELDRLRKEMEDLTEQKQMLISELTTAREDAESVETVSSEKDAEVERLKEEIRRQEDALMRLQEEHRRFKVDAEERVAEYKSQLLMAVEESGQNSSRDVDQLSLKDVEIRRLEDALTRLREEMESCIRERDNEIDALKKQVIAAKEDSEELDKALIAAREVVGNHQKEILDLKSELSHIQDEAGQSQTKGDLELERMREEFAREKALANERESQLDTAAEDLKLELSNMIQEMDEKKQIIDKLEKEVIRIKQSAQCEELEKNTQIASLEEIVDRLRKDLEESTVEKVSKITELEQQLRENQEGHIRDEGTELEKMRLELATVRGQTVGHMKDKDDEIERLNKELAKVKEEFETSAENRVSEIERLTAECKIKAELEDIVKVRDIETENLRSEIVRITAEFEDRLTNKNCEFENARTELIAVGQESENLIGTKDQEIIHLQEELLKLKGIEAELVGQLKDAESQLRDCTSVNERLDAQIFEIREQSENLIRRKENEMRSLKDEFAKSRENADGLIQSKDSEIQKLLAEIECMREEGSRVQASSDIKIEDLEKRLEAFQSDARNSESLNLELEALRAECERMKLVIDKQESEIEQLKEEVGRGRNLMEASFERRENEQLETSSPGGLLESSPNQTNSSPSSSGETVATLELRLKEREERENKLKQLTLKAKKEAADFKAKLTASRKELDVANAKLLEASSHKENNQSIQYQGLQTEYDKLESLFESEKSTRLELQKSLKQAVEELSNTKGAVAELTEEKSKTQWELQRLEREKKDLETLRVEKEKEVQAERIQREQLAREKSELEKRATKAESQSRDTEDEKKMEIKQLQDQLKAAKQELNFAKTEIQQTNMMDLEIADYERTVKTLHETVADRETKLKTLQEEVEQQEEQRAALQKLLDSSGSQYSQLDDHCNKLKQLLVKSKKDLAEAKKLEGEQRSSDAQLRGNLERLTQLTEEQKLQISSLVSENQKQAEKLRIHSDSHQRTAQSLEQRVQSLENDLQSSRFEMAEVQAEYDSYKVRVHSVLKHQKTRSSGSDDASVEQERFERQQMEKLVESLKTKLADVSQQRSSISSEYDLLQEEHDRLQVRHSKLVAEMEANERGWRDRLEKLNTETSLNSMKKVEVIQQLTVQTEVISSSFKDQIQSIHEEHQRVVDSLRHQLETAEIELDRYHARFQNMSQNYPSNSTPSFPALEHETSSSSDRVLEFVKELRQEERQSGEGSETVDDVHAKMSSTANHNLLPFEQLLDSTQMDDVMSVKTMESTAEEMTLRLNLASSEKRIEHLSQILNESEATVLRLTEQASILKGEIRRMERNQERETAISNMEYLKNVVYKFLTLKSGDERMQLIPVLTTMLKFSPDEKDKMTAIAAGNEGVPPAGQDATGWGTYLHRWSGLV